MAINLRAIGLVLLWGCAAGAQSVTLQTAPDDSALISGMFTPTKVREGGVPLRAAGSTGQVEILGQSVRFEARSDGRRNHYLGLDCNGDGQIERSEFESLGRSNSASFTVDTDAGAVSIEAVGVSISMRGETVGSVSGNLIAASALRASHDGLTLRLIDDNLDGRFTQDGDDAIAIGDGRNRVAMPLREIHQFGPDHCRIEVEPDGSEIRLTPIDDPQLGQVDTGFTGRSLQCLIVTDPQGHCYDLAVSDRIPAGDYQVHYGVIASGSTIVLIRPTPDSLTYAIMAERNNRLRIGSPLWLQFMVSFVNDNITVGTTMHVMDAGNHRYDVSGDMGLPSVALLNGDRVLHNGRMSYG